MVATQWALGSVDAGWWSGSLIRSGEFVRREKLTADFPVADLAIAAFGCMTMWFVGPKQRACLVSEDLKRCGISKMRLVSRRSDRRGEDENPEWHFQ